MIEKDMRDLCSVNEYNYTSISNHGPQVLRVEAEADPNFDLIIDRSSPFSRREKGAGGMRGRSSPASRPSF